MPTDRRRAADVEDAEHFFDGSDLGRLAFRRVHALVTACGPCELRVAKTQVGWARRRGFAYLWRPGRWLRHPSAEVVLTIDLPRRDSSARFKEVVEPRPKLFVHHLELHDVADIDEEVERWLQEAFAAAG